MDKSLNAPTISNISREVILKYQVTKNVIFLFLNHINCVSDTTHCNISKFEIVILNSIDYQK